MPELSRTPLSVYIVDHCVDGCQLWKYNGKPFNSCCAASSTGSDAPEDKRGVYSAEAERVGQNGIHALCSASAGGVIEVTLGVRIAEIDCRREVVVS